MADDVALEMISPAPPAGEPAAPAVGEGMPLSQLDALLAEHLFGRADYIIGEMHSAYRRRLAKVASTVPTARRVLNALDRATGQQRYRAFGDTAFRCAVQHAHVHVEAGIPFGVPASRCAEVFDDVARGLEDGEEGVVGARLGDRLGESDRLGWVWDEGCPDDVVVGAFRSVVDDNYTGLPLCTPNDRERAVLAQAVDLLSDLLPKVAASALSHTQIVAVFGEGGRWGATSSSSEFRVSGTLFLNRRTLANPWTAAEHLLHETLHQQLYDFRQGHSLLGPGYGRRGAPLVHSLWNMPTSTRDNYWDVHRAVAAFHVYVHLALLATAAEQRVDGADADLSRYGPVTMTGRRTALARARYLGDELRAGCWDELGEAGRRLVEWFDSVLRLLDDEPLLPGSFIHLLLDRYWREMDAVAARTADGRWGDSDQLRLGDLADDEVTMTRSILASLGLGLDAFDRGVHATEDEPPLPRFLAVRDHVARALVGACAQPYRLGADDEGDERVRHMVEASSESLRTLLGR